MNDMPILWRKRRIVNKSYKLIADVIANRFRTVDKWSMGNEKMNTLTEIITITEDFIRLLRLNNPKFNRIQFIEYINKQRGDTYGKLLT